MKVLIVSHNCFSTIQNMGKTLLSLFQEFKKNELMQLYLYPSIPNVDVCGSYFRITDQDVIKAIFQRSHCGNTVCAQKGTVSEVFDSHETAERYSSVNRNSSLLRRMRDLAWKFGKWKSKELKNWLVEGKPDVVFYALGDASFSQNIAMWISKYLNIPLVTYVCDEFYFSGKQSSRLEVLLNAGMLSNLRKTIKHSKLIISICDNLGKEYEVAFGTPYRTIMTGSSYVIGSLSHPEKRNNQISYIGNLGLNRHKSLLDIQEAINEFNDHSNIKYELVYYGRENTELIGKIKYGGFLDPNGVRKVMAESTLLVHAETFDRELRARLKFSVSTKIADSLASGTCLFAYGPAELASIAYLDETESAYCVTDYELLRARLCSLLGAPDIIREYAEKGTQTAWANHDSVKNSHYLYKVLSSVVQNIRL